MTRDYDLEARERIKNDIHCNFFLEAGAGSGKTSVLVDRMLAMVEAGIDISRICAITFTKAAAGEFYARFQKKLSESDSELAKEALKNIDLCFMGTIDSFCNMVLSEHPARAGIPSNASVLEESEMEGIYLREYSRILKGEYNQELQQKARRFSGLFYNHRELFLKGFGMLASARTASFNYLKPEEGSADEIFAEEKKRLCEILNFLLLHPEIMSVESNQKAAASWAELQENIALIEDSWDDNLGDVAKALKGLKDLRIMPEYEGQMDKLGPGWEHYFTAHYTRNKLGWFEINADEDPLLTERLKNHMMAVAMDFISDSVEPICRLLKSEGNLTFYDYLLYLRNMLAEDAAGEGRLISHIYERHSYFLIDEFQDTDPIQAEIFFYLTAVNPQADWRNCRPRPGSLFLVGDPKQSIYRFRNADVSSFLRIRNMFENADIGEVLYLSRNFRSSDNMCRAFNDMFTRLLPEDTDIQSCFNEIPTGEKADYKGSLEGCYSYCALKGRRTEDNEDPELVAGIIREIIDNPEITIQDRGEGSRPRRADYSDIMIITPTKSHMTLYMKALQRMGIPFKVEGKLLFDECPALVAVSKIMWAASDPDDRKAAFGAVKLSGCNIDREKIKEYADRGKTMTSAGLFSTILEEEEVFAKAGTDNAEYVYFALELLRTAETDGSVSSIREGAEYVRTLALNQSGDERCLQLQQDQNRVHMANLHKVKGLEAPIVILADSDSRKREAESRVDFGKSPAQSYIFALDNSMKSTDFPEEKELEEEVLEAERTRLLYVAATRASNALIVSVAVTGKGENSKSNVWLPLLNGKETDLFSVISPKTEHFGAEGERLSAEELFMQGRREHVLNDRTAEEASYHIERPSDITLKGIKSSEDDYEDKASDEIDEMKKREDAMLKGTMVHRLMEMIISSGGAIDAADAIREIVQEYEPSADRETMAVMEAMLKNVADRMLYGGYPQSNGIPDDIVAEVLSAEEVHCELPFCHENEKGILHGVIDLLYLKDGSWHIVDYKTNAAAEGLDEHYREQLEAYVKAFRDLTGQEADARTYHIELPNG